MRTQEWFVAWGPPRLGACDCVGAWPKRWAAQVSSQVYDASVAHTLDAVRAWLMLYQVGADQGERPYFGSHPMGP